MCSGSLLVVATLLVMPLLALIIGTFTSVPCRMAADPTGRIR